jgi:cyanophycinase
MRLATTIGGTAVAKAIREHNANGGHVAGTSAGASFLSEHMIAFGDDNRTPHAGSVTLAPGLGLTNRVVIDQHFTQRARLGRLITALAFNPFLIGLGLDEDTAAFIAPDQTVEVEGSGTLTIVDASRLKFSSMDRAGVDDPVSMLGLTMHVLIRGATFNLHTRDASAGTLAVSKS